MDMIEHLSTETWKQILKLLGTGQFIRVEFRPPAYEGELEELAKMNGLTALHGWWICEATYHLVTYKDGSCNEHTWSEVVQKIPFKL